MGFGVCRLSATVCKVGFMLAERGFSQWFVPAGIAVGILCSSSGFFCQVIFFLGRFYWWDVDSCNIAESFSADSSFSLKACIVYLINSALLKVKYFVNQHKFVTRCGSMLIS